MKRCNICDIDYTDDKVFCKKCGAKLTSGQYDIFGDKMEHHKPESAAETKVNMFKITDIFLFLSIFTSVFPFIGIAVSLTSIIINIIKKSKFWYILVSIILLLIAVVLSYIYLHLKRTAD